jgi:hypothetical protein
MACCPQTCPNQSPPENFTTLGTQPLHDGSRVRTVNSKTKIMKQRYITAGITFGPVAILNIDAHAAYKEEWLSPHALQKEEAATSSHHPSVYAC